MRRVGFLFLASLLAFACTKDDSSAGAPPSQPPTAPRGPKELREAEPNDTLAQALRLSESSVIEAEIASGATRPDADFFWLEAREGKTADFMVRSGEGLDLALELLDRDGNHVAVFNSQPKGQGERIARLYLGAPYVVRVFSAAKGGQGAYTAQFAYSDAAPRAEREPNNRAVEATALVLAESTTGYLADKADEDWYRFELPPAAAQEEPAAEADAAPSDVGGEKPSPGLAGQPPDSSAGLLGQAPMGAGEGAAPAADAGLPVAPPAVVRIDVGGVPGARLQIELANEAQAIFFSARSREPGEGLQVRNVALRPGERVFFVIMKSAWTGSGKEADRGFNVEAPYSLTLALEDATGASELESNDEPEKATVLPAPGRMQGFFSPKGDTDYFLVRSEQPSLLKVELSGVNRIDSTLALVREGGKEQVLIRANDGAVREGESLVNLATSPGNDLLLKVDAAPRQVDGKWVRDQENPSEPYSLTISARPDQGLDEREPNDDLESATPLSFSQPLRGLVHPRKDADYYRFDLSDSPVKVPIRASVTGILKVDVALALYRLGEGKKLELIQRAEKGKGAAPESIRFSVDPGVYLLQVRDTKDWQSNFLDAYQVMIERE